MHSRYSCIRCTRFFSPFCYCCCCCFLSLFSSLQAAAPVFFHSKFTFLVFLANESTWWIVFMFDSPADRSELSLSVKPFHYTWMITATWCLGLLTNQNQQCFSLFVSLPFSPFSHILSNTKLFGFAKMHNLSGFMDFNVKITGKRKSANYSTLNELQCVTSKWKEKKKLFTAHANQLVA